MGEEWVLELHRPTEAGRDVDALTEEFRALKGKGYEFAEGHEWSPAELFRKMFPKDQMFGGR